MNNSVKGHLCAAATVFIWGMSFISTKILLNEFTPPEILFLRFALGYAALWTVCPRVFKVSERRRELVFAAAGLCGTFLYYSLENTALVYTSAANAGVIVSVSPFFTALLWRIISKERLSGRFLAGFVLAAAGIVIIGSDGSYAGGSVFGDILALAAALVWSVYSVLTHKISGYGYDRIQTVRRTFFYGLAFMLPSVVFGAGAGAVRNLDTAYAANLFFLGLGASALCFVTWNTASAYLGAVKTSAYIYAVPAVTAAASVIVLKEPFTANQGLGTVLILSGLILSERKEMRKSESK